MDLIKHERTKYDIPLSHLDFDYIDKCKNAGELEKIVKVLRSGCEGHYPELEKLAEKRLQDLKPDSKVLRKEKPAILKNYLDKSEKEKLDTELLSWENEIRSKESAILEGQKPESQSLPEIRGTSKSIPIDKKTAEEEAKKKRRVKPRDYNEWDKIDIDAELAKVDGMEPKFTNKNVLRTKTDIPETIDTSGLTDAEKLFKANREKEKGNEAFRCGDFSEALLYYNRSLSLWQTPEAYNNRAMTYIKLKQWMNASNDCNKVLGMEPKNVKAFLRRALASQGNLDYIQAKQDLETVLKLDPNNKRAKQVLAEVEKSLSEQKVKGRRLNIVEVEGSDEEEEIEVESRKTKTESVPKEKTTTTASADQKSEPNDSKKNEDESRKNTRTKNIAQTSDEKLIWNEDEIPTEHAKETKKDTSTSASSTINTRNIANGDVKETTNVTTERRETTENNATEEKDIKIPGKIEETKKGQVKACQIEDTRKEKKEEGRKEKSMTQSVQNATKESTPAELPAEGTRLKEKADSLYRCGQYGECVELYDKCMRILKEAGTRHDATLVRLYYKRANAYHKMGDCQTSITDCNKVLEMCNKDDKIIIEALKLRARCYEDLERYQKAYADYRQILLLDSSVELAQQGSDRCSQMLYRQHGSKWRQALNTSQPILAPSIETLEKYSEEEKQSVACQKKNEGTSNQRTEKEDKDKENILETNEELFEKYKKMGNNLVKQGDFHSAIEWYNKCVIHCPQNAVSYVNRALCYLKTKQYNDVVSDCTCALSIDKHNIKALFRRALAYKELKQFEQSVADFKHLLTVDKSNSAARKEFAAVLRLKQQSECEEKSQKTRHRLNIQETDSDDEEDDIAVRSQTTTSKNATKTQEKASNAPERKDLEKGEKTANVPQSVAGKNRGRSHDGSTTADTSKKAARGSGKRNKKKNVHKKTEDNQEKAADHHSETADQPKCTSPYEFLQTWTSLKSTHDITQFAALLYSIEPQDMQKVISNKLDGNMLSTFIKCMTYMAKKGDTQRCLEYFLNLPQVSRFGVVSMFMTEQDKKETSTLLKLLAESLPGILTEQEVHRIKKLYSI